MKTFNHRSFSLSLPYLLNISISSEEITIIRKPFFHVYMCLGSELAAYQRPYKVVGIVSVLTMCTRSLTLTLFKPCRSVFILNARHKGLTYVNILTVISITSTPNVFDVLYVIFEYWQEVEITLE